MAEPVNKDVEFCRRRAEDFRRMAAQEVDPEVKRDYLELEARWLNLAVGYEFPDRMAEYSANLACAFDQDKKAG